MTMDETTPLLAEIEDGRRDYVRARADPETKPILELDGSDNPQEWPSSFKWGMVALLSISSFTVYENRI